MMLALTSLLLMLATVLTIVHGQASVCYSSLDCHGNLLNVVLPEKAGASAFSSECCSAAVRGLSYQSQDGEAGCQNCYTDANFESRGDKFYLGLFGNFQPNDFFRIGKVRLSVTPIGAGQSRFTLDFLGKDNKYTAPTEVELKADDVNLDSEKTRDQAIIVRSETGDQLSVVAYAEEYSSSDTFKVMPCVRLPDSGYEYYAVSVPRAGLTFTHIITQEEISAPLQGKSAMVIVTTEENTEISITLTQDITNIDANDIMDQIGGGDTLRAGEEYSFTFSKGAQTLYLASEDDLTGSRVVSNKPIAFISGHECGTVPFNIHYCDQLIEQLPPTSTWGRRFITAPIAARAAVDIFKVLASRNGTIFQSSCFSDILILDAGEFREFNISSSSFCYFESNQPVLMVQFSVASDLDQVLAGDPFMVVIPPIEQYRNSYNISIFNSSVPDVEQTGVNYINILIPADSTSPDEVRFDGQPLPPVIQFREISCIFSEGICAFATQVNISSVPHFLTTVNSNAMVNAIVYWLSLHVGSGYFAGMTQNPIALPSISLDQDAYVAMENATLNITIFRSGDLTLPVTVYLTTAPMSGDNAALVGDDFIPETRELILAAGVDFLDVFITFVNDVFPEGPEQFEVFLSAAPGALMVSPAYASVTILNDDPSLPVMNVSFAVTDVVVSEGEEAVTLLLEKTEGAIGPVSVRIFTTAGTAIDGRDFAAINDTLEFGVDVTQMEVMIFITDNSALEDVEQFIVEIEPVPGIFPVAVMESIATVTITDNDVVVLGFERTDYSFGELSNEAALVRVEVLLGQLERSVTIWINSTEASTATPNQDFAEVSRVLTFDAECTIDFVSIGIFHDSEREVLIETINLQLSFVEEERSSGLLLFPSQATVNIVDNDEVEVGLRLIRGTVREGAGGARVNASVVQGSLGDNTVFFIVSTVNGSAQGGLDYVQMETIIPLSGQNPFEELLIPIVDDSEYEGPDDEQFFVQIRLAPNGQNSERVMISADLEEVSINITDNERRPVARIGFVREAWTVSEDAGEVILLVESDGSNVDPVIVSYSLNGTGTAQDGSDFVLTGMGVLLFPPGAIIDSIIIPILDDELPESIESFSISLSPGLDVDLTTALATVTINDNDAVMVRFSMPSYTMSEAAMTVRVAVQISSASEPVRVNVGTMDATALAEMDYMPVHVQLVFLPGDFEKTIIINLVNDNLREGQELLFVSLHSPISNLRVEVPNPTSNIFIIDDDRDTPLEPSLSISSISATSASLEWTQDLDQPVTMYFLNWTYTGPCARQPPQSAIVSETARSFTITRLEEGGSYTFGLTAINGEGTSPESTATGQTLPAVPISAPSNLQTTSVTETSISIRWDEIECLEQNGAITGYTISLNSSPLSTTLPNIRTFMLTGLSPQTSYTIIVFGANAQGNGPSRSITIQTAGCPVSVPSSPSVVLREQGSTSISLSWTQPLSDEVNSYIVRATYLGNCSSFSISPVSNTLNGTARQFVFRNLQEFSTYQFSVIAVNSAGQSAESTLVADTISAAPSVGPVPVLELTTETTIAVRWNSINCIDQNGPMITYYEARLNNGAVIIATSGTRAIFNDLNPMTNYTIDVRAQNSQGAGPFGTALTVATNFSDFSGIVATCYSDLRCDPASNIAFMSARQCCVDNPNGLSFVIPGLELCYSCIVFGFFNDSFSGVEQGPGHSVQVGYQKRGLGISPNLVFNVVTVPGTAGEGDYTVITSRVRAVFSSTRANVAIRFNVDGIAQERNETLILELVPATVLPTGGAVFFRKYLSLTIVDSDSVSISFANDDYRAFESSGKISVVVIKDHPIATPVTLSVIPRTVSAQIESGSSLPPNIPADDLRSPPFADMNDFDSTPLTLTIPPDEGTLGVADFPITIGIVDDAIDEAEQVFVVQLQVVNSINQFSIDFSAQPSSLCRIIDNDLIRIGFELPGYTYTEPQFDEFIDELYVSPTGQPENGLIFLVKENNATSELTFLVSFQVTDSAPTGIQSASIDQDYRFGQAGQTSRTEFFFPTQQRVPFRFELRADTLPEGTEAFQASVFPEDTRDRGDGTVEQFPTSLNHLTLRSEIFITILDNDPIIIGFTDTSYTVDEGIGILRVDIQVVNVPDDQPLPAPVDLVIQTVPGSAIGRSDYAEISADTLDVLLIFDNDNRRRSFNVAILDDSLLELDVEYFTLELRFDPFAHPQPSNVILSPNVSTVEILDDDTVVIGFLNTFYTVGESDKAANIQIGVIQGTLDRPVVVRFSTNAFSAVDGSDYSVVVGREFTFDFTVRVVNASVSLINDDTFELTESFGASLAFPGAPPSRVTLDPDTAQVTILDDDVLTFGFEPIVYDVSESVGSVNLGIVFISGNAGEFVPHVNVFTEDGTATGSGGEADYVSVVDQSISFTSANRNQDLIVQITRDDFTEFNENFTAALSSVFLARTTDGVAFELTDEESTRLVRDPDTATVNILDDDGK